MTQTKFILLFLLVFSTATYTAVCFYNDRKSEKGIEAVSNCRDGETLFKNDLAKNQLKYFTFGLAPDEKYTAMLHDKYHSTFETPCLIHRLNPNFLRGTHTA